jgi:hypothetical protein
MPRSPRGRSALGSGSADRGTALMEVLVTVLLLAMVVGALLPLLTSGQQGFDYSTRRETMIRNGRIALDKLIREMRAAESFRALAPGQIDFTLLWGDGTGAEPTVQYVLNTVTHNLEYRWSGDYDYREQMTVRTLNAVPAGYAAALTFNHAALVAAGKSLASGDDVRIRYWNGTAFVDLDRVLDPTSAWNSATTKIWFRLQAAIAALAADANYYVHYGNLVDASPPAYAPNIFLDYQDGTTLDGWVRRDGLPGTNSTSATTGFVFQSTLGNGSRELTKNVPHGDVEVFWGFWSATTDNADGHDAGIGARLSDTGAGYRVTVSDQNNMFLRIRYWTGWSQTGGVIGSVVAPTLPGRSYFARFYLVGPALRAKFWLAGTPEPAGWQLNNTIDGRAATGNHYGQLDGYRSPENHRHSTVIIRPRVALEPFITLGAETSGARPDALAALAGPFRSLTVACFDAAHTSIACAPPAPVRAVQVSLVVMDPVGVIPDITMTDEAYRQSP